MGNTPSEKQQSVDSYWKVWKILAITSVFTLMTAYPVGMLLGLIDSGGANCVNLGLAGSGCHFPNPFTYFFGLIYAAPFWLGVFHFGFTDKKRWWYYILAALFAKFLYVGMDSLIYEVVAIGGGVLIGLAVSAHRSKRS